MPNVDTTKKPAATQHDWHRADIKAALEKRGWTLRRLSIANGYEGKSLATVLRTPWPKAERIVGDAIGVPPARIWPTRYNRNGKPKSGRGERGLGRYDKRQHSTATLQSNVNPRGRG